MRVGLTVAGIEVAITTPKGPLEAIIADRYEPFLGPVVAPACRLRVESTGEGRGSSNPPMATVDGAGGDRVVIGHPDFRGEIDLDGDGAVDVSPDVYTVDHLLRVLFGLLAPRHDAAMLHSCGMIIGGDAHVFVGPSGAGKSTLASLAGERPLLSDEHVMVRRDRAGWIAASTPFWGSYARPGPARWAPLAQIWSLRHWPVHQARSLSGVECLKLCLGNAVLPAPSPPVRQAVFDVVGQLAADVPAAELRFAPVDNVWEEVEARVVA